MSRYNEADYALITPEWLKENDGKIVWIRDDYLMCSPMVKHSDPEMFNFLEHVYETKRAARQSGWAYEN